MSVGRPFGTFGSEGIGRAPAPNDKPPLPRLAFDLAQLTVRDAALDREAFRIAAGSIRSCEDARLVAKAIGGRLSRERSVRSDSLPFPISSRLAELPEGHATQVFRIDEDAMSVLVLCSRKRFGD